MGDSDPKISGIDTKFHILERQLDSLTPPTPPTLTEQVTALHMLIGMWPNVDTHRAGLHGKGIRPEAVQAILDELRMPLYAKLAVLVREGNEADTIRGDNVVTLQIPNARTRPSKR